MAARVTTLTGLLYEGIAPTMKGPDGSLPAVLPIVLYTGQRSWPPAELADPLPGLPPYIADPPYLLLDVRALAAHDLPQGNRLSVLVRLETARSPEELLETLREALTWLGDDELGPVFVNWVSEVLMPLRFPDADRTEIEDLQEGTTMLAETAKEWTEQWFAEGLQEGLQQGRVEGLEQGRVQGLEQGRVQGLERGPAGHGRSDGVADGAAQVRRRDCRTAVAGARPHCGPPPR